MILNTAEKSGYLITVRSLRLGASAVPSLCKNLSFLELPVPSLPRKLGSTCCDGSKGISSGNRANELFGKGKAEEQKPDK